MSDSGLRGEDPLETAVLKDGFNTVDFINRLFPTETSLSGLEPLIQQLRHRIHRIDEDILTSVRLQSTTGVKAKHDVQEAQRVIQELFQQVLEIRRKADQSERIVNEICRDIRKLDNAKKHLTLTISALNNLSNLITSMDRLQALAEARNYQEAAGLLQAVTTMMAQFEPYGQIPKVAELKSRFSTIRGALKMLVMDDFRFLTGASHEAPVTPEHLATLTLACRVVEAMDLQVREEVIGQMCQKEVGTFNNIFSASQGESAKLEKSDRRFQWIRKQVFSRQEVWRVFPEGWCVPHSITAALCKVARIQIATMLDETAGNLDVAALLKALNDAIEFERELVEKFGGPTAALAAAAEAIEVAQDDEVKLKAERNTEAAEVKKKYEKSKVDQYKDAVKKVEISARPNFRGIVSSVFEPHLNVYVQLVEAELLKRVDHLAGQEDWTGGIANDVFGEVLRSANEIFAEIKKNLKRTASLTRGQTLASLHRTFSKVVRAYAARLAAKMPRPQGQQANGAPPPKPVLGTTDWHVRLSDSDAGTVCLLINTANYSRQLAQDLAVSVEKMLDDTAAQTLDPSPECDDLSNVAAAGVTALVLGVETSVEPGLLNLSRRDWSGVEAVGDQSEYVNLISQAIGGVGTVAGRRLSENDFRFFIDKVVDSFMPRYQEAVFRCRRLSEAAVQQLLLDAHAVKSILLEVPSASGHAAYSSHAKAVNRGIGKIEGFLKVVMCVTEASIDNFAVLMPGAGPADFQRVVEAKNISRPEKQQLLDDFARRFGAMPPPAPNPAGAKMTEALRRIGNLKDGGLDVLPLQSLKLGDSGAAVLQGVGRGLTDGTKRLGTGLATGFKKMGGLFDQL